MDFGNDESADEQVGAAIAIRDRGRDQEAIERLVEIIATHPRSAFALLVLGGLYRDHGRLESAVKCFQEAVKLRPTHELSSLGLFHSHYDLGNWQAAVVEAARFLGVAESKAYREMIPELLRRHRGNDA